MEQHQIQAMIRKNIQQALENDLDYRINRNPLEHMEDFEGHDVTHEPELLILDELDYNAWNQLIRSDYSEVREHALLMMKDFGISDPPEEDLNKVCHSLLRALPAYYAIQKRRAVGDFDPEEESKILEKHNLGTESPESPEPPVSKLSGPEEPQPTISGLVDNYWEDRSPTWKPRSAKDYKNSKERLIEYLGKDTPVSSINYETMKGYRKSLQDSGLSVARINFYIGFASAVFNHEMKTTAILKVNPAGGLKMKDKRRKDKLRDAFTTADLSKLFSPDSYLKYAKQPAQYWVPLISLYTGCRLEEACQLYVDQIREVSGTWCMVIDEEHPDQSVKTSEKREVPLHPDLLNLGLHRYAQELPEGDRLWPELKRQNHRYGHYLGRMFGRYKKDCGLSSKVSFHSFRGTVETELREKDVDPVWIDILVGHSVAGEGASRYLQRKPSVILEKAVSKLEWDKKLNLSALMDSEFTRPE